jgi:hypothetical protein
MRMLSEYRGRANEMREEGPWAWLPGPFACPLRVKGDLEYELADVTTPAWIAATVHPDQYRGVERRRLQWERRSARRE